MTTHTGRRTQYGAITFRSRLEAEFAASLDRENVEWRYEPQAYAAKSGGSYLPDFQVYGGMWFVETKPEGADTGAALKRMHAILDSLPNAILEVHIGRWIDGHGYNFDFGPICMPFGRGCGQCDRTHTKKNHVAPAQRSRSPRGTPVTTRECAADLDRLGVPVEDGQRAAINALREAGIEWSRAAIRAAVKYRFLMREEPESRTAAQIAYESLPEDRRPW